jgi:hypothetical protein
MVDKIIATFYFHSTILTFFQLNVLTPNRSQVLQTMAVNAATSAGSASAAVVAGAAGMVAAGAGGAAVGITAALTSIALVSSCSFTLARSRSIEVLT